MTVAAAYERCALIADKWRDENKAAAERERKHGSTSMADRLEGAAVECNAIAQEIRSLARLSPTLTSGASS